MAWVIALLLAVVSAGGAPAQSVRPADLGAGKLLVASRDLGDPNFARTVVLLVQHDEEGAMGLIVNRESRLTLAKVFDDMKGAKENTERAYLGGPVGRTGVLALLRSKTKVEDTKLVFGDVYLVSSKPVVEKTLASHAGSNRFRAYLGYAGWGPGQLEHEVELGGWFIFRANSEMVFAPDPESIWQRLIQATESQIARVVRFSGGGGQ